MALRDHEQQQLDEIERELVRESPRLARRFAAFHPVRLSTLAAAAAGLLALLSTGLVITVVGIGMGSPGPIVVGALLIALVPATLIRHFTRGWKQGGG
ncbi:DUF3040 domain-containing protein [Amycolatopsis orientalis]|uniref:DUF3040 domain-containing protein n=1 Tax=Amycolatopsis orientalis TaxID=31958 RepID=UPI0003A27DBC|nr:DUF3040 domain-containing protein [Amycolatopsis orientalis]